MKETKIDRAIEWLAQDGRIEAILAFVTLVAIACGGIQLYLSSQGH